MTADTVLLDDDGAENTTLHAKLGWNATREPALATRRARHRCANGVRHLRFPTRFMTAAARPTSDAISCLPSTRRGNLEYVRSEHRRRGARRLHGRHAGVRLRGRDRASGVHGQLSGVRGTRSSTASTSMMSNSSPTTARRAATRGVLPRVPGGIRRRILRHARRALRRQRRLRLAYEQPLEPRVYPGPGRRAVDQVSRQRRHRVPCAEPVRARVQSRAVRVPAGVGLRTDEETSEGYDVGIEYDAAGLHSK